jgi:prepilin-type N-terminal cleavage/methylation domain-containing protein
MSDKSMSADGESGIPMAQLAATGASARIFPDHVMAKANMPVTKAFTLVEILVVVLILGALAAIALPRVVRSSDAAKVNVCKRNVDIINEQIELYYASTGQWPRNLNQLTRNKDYFPEGAPECPFGTRYQYSEDTHHVPDHDH